MGLRAAIFLFKLLGRVCLVSRDALACSWRLLWSRMHRSPGDVGLPSMAAGLPV